MAGGAGVGQGPCWGDKGLLGAWPGQGSPKQLKGGWGLGQLPVLSPAPVSCASILPLQLRLRWHIWDTNAKRIPRLQSAAKLQ